MKTNQLFIVTCLLFLGEAGFVLVVRAIEEELPAAPKLEMVQQQGVD